jgi:hypothetical protein
MRPLKRQLRSVEAHWRVGHGDRLTFSQLPLGKIDRIAHNGVPQIPQVNPNLVCPPGAWNRFHERLAIAAPRQHAKTGSRLITTRINHPKPILSRLSGNWLSRDDFVPVRLPEDPAPIGLCRNPAGKLTLQTPHRLTAAGKDNKSGGIRIEAMHW